MVVRLDNELWFPDPHFGEDDGCIAVGGDLSVDRLLLAYSYGIFPWYAYRYDDPVWYCPMQRFVIFPEEIHISHSMRTMMNKDKYQVSMNQAFDTVIETCGKLRENEDMGWLGPQMTEAYKELYRQGFAASVEVWEKTETDGQTEKRFVGGLYGVTIGNSFFGESMCSLVPSASKLALIYLAKAMARAGGRLIDCQLETPHLTSMGGRFIPDDEYLKIIRE